MFKPLRALSSFLHPSLPSSLLSPFLPQSLLHGGLWTAMLQECGYMDDQN